MVGEYIMFYTDEQLSMILSAAAPICEERECDDEICLDSYEFLGLVCGRDVCGKTIESLLRTLEKYDLA